MFGKKNDGTLDGTLSYEPFVEFIDAFLYKKTKEWNVLFNPMNLDESAFWWWVGGKRTKPAVL